MDIRLMASEEPAEDPISRRKLTSKWTIEIHDSFVGQVIDGDLRLLSQGPPVRTIWIGVWSRPIEDPPSETLAWIRQHVHPSPEQRFEEPGADAGELRYASWYPHTVNGRHQWGLYAYTVRHGSYVQATFLADEAEELEWALAAWRSLRYIQDGR